MPGLRSRDGALADRRIHGKSPHCLRHFEVCHREVSRPAWTSLRYSHGVHALHIRARTAQFISQRLLWHSSPFRERIMHGMPPVLYEDGNQMRDYVNVRDIA